MKKIFFTAFVAAILFTVNANAQISVGVGYANETVISKEADKLGEGTRGHSWSKTRMKLDGIYLECSYNWDLADVGPGFISLQPGIRYNWLTTNDNTAKARFVTDAEGGSDKMKVNLSVKERSANHFFDIPLHVKYSYEVIPGDFRTYVFAGPVFSLGLVAKNVSYTKGYATSADEKVRVYDFERINAYNGKYFNKSYNIETEDFDVETIQSDEYKVFDMFDLKLGLGIGVTVSEMVDVKFGYNIGMINRSHVKNDDSAKYSAHSNVLYFGMTYNF